MYSQHIMQVQLTLKKTCNQRIFTKLPQIQPPFYLYKQTVFFQGDAEREREENEVVSTFVSF